MTFPSTHRGVGEFPLLPAGFQFGTATAAYQVEGAAAQDGRGPSVWDTWSAVPGHVADGSTGEVASDHYHRVEEDVALLAGLGAPGYRFSISWPRVLPTGSGQVNAAGLDFYDRLVDSLLEHGLAPMATLFHYDLPQGLEDDGGWLNRATADRFAEYAGIVGERLADRVAHWVPVNDPSVVTMFGYGEGRHAPGKALLFDCLPVAHHLLLAHGRAAQALRAAGAASVGCANNHAPIWPASEDEADTGVSKVFDQMWNGLFLEPMLLGRYPVDLAPLMEDVVAPGDMATIRQPLDFYGINYYYPARIAAAPEEEENPFQFVEVLGHPQTDAGSPVVPDALREFLIIFRARYRAALPPIFITECGAAYNTGPDEHGVVDDQPRIDFYDAHLRAVSEAVNRGVDVRAFYAWSLLDCFEWAKGLEHRFGLVHVDFETQRRTPKRSYEWFAAMVASQPVDR
ncbi:GH1 family beta-glucosidase [Nocardioides campestrisoli]|uniref:GH1 family beta-glucosidase n=1 Tax=Nocardioides campestrisoli TaxID=2736757 RepID=UPI001CD78625|nr:GH1 family beta-glucosidase [Nocardioides campestrisoli]